MDVLGTFPHPLCMSGNVVSEGSCVAEDSDFLVFVTTALSDPPQIILF